MQGGNAPPDPPLLVTSRALVTSWALRLEKFSGNERENIFGERPLRLNYKKPHKINTTSTRNHKEKPCNYLNGQPAKNIFSLIRQKTVLEENKERGNGP